MAIKFEPNHRCPVEPAACALCDTPLNEANNSQEHIIPNAIGGRKTIRNFICRKCNNTTGANWDNELAAQLQPLCTMLNIQRGRGKNQSVTIETVKDEKFLLRPDGSMTIPKTIFSKRDLGDKTAINIQAGSIGDLKKVLQGLAPKYPNLDIGEILRQANPVKEYLQDPWSISLRFGGELPGRSIIKSSLALAYEAGLHINGCEHARKYLLSDGEPCFGYYNETDVVRNRPPKTFFHCIYVCGDPATKQVLGYVEYFGYQRIVTCLSSNYDGAQFSCRYAIDPITGKELDIDVHLEFTPTDIASIYAYRKVDYDNVRVGLESLMATWKDRDEKRAINHAVEDAVEFAFANCGAQPGERLSEEHGANLIGLLWDKLAPFIIHLLSSRTFSPNDLRNIAIRSGHLGQSAENEGD